MKDVEEVDISCLKSPGPMLWAEDENEREQTERGFVHQTKCICELWFCRLAGISGIGSNSSYHSYQRF